MTHTLHFTLGPVQGFIADARRLRDFWAGSFLLSYLSGCAMVAVSKHGQIDFPRVDGDPLFDAIRGKGSQRPHIGSLPNRFQASGIKDPKAVADAADKAVRDAWQKIANAVWDKFLKPVNAGQKTRDIWDQQVDHFWEIAWVAHKTGDGDQAALDRRKNWRLPSRPDECGEMCRLMGQFQELSGLPKFGHKDQRTEFWNNLRKSQFDERKLGLNLDDGEYLCAIALIKRLFPLVAKEAIGWVSGGEEIDIRNLPSTSYISAIPWLRLVKTDADTNTFNDCVKKTFTSGYLGEIHTRQFKGLGKHDTSRFSQNDGHLYHRDGLQAMFKEHGVSDSGKIKCMTDSLIELHKSVGDQPSEFYAVLQMDGDHIGRLLNNYPKTVKEALFLFTAKVSAYFHPDNNTRDGVLVYAGGDDVRAFLPLQHAIAAAQDIRRLYSDAVLEAISNIKEGADADAFTLSAAIVFAQYKIPMRTVLREAEKQLDDVAKKENGRDSLALAIYKPGGITQAWVSGWAEKENPIGSLRRIIAENDNYSTGFAYNLLTRYQELLPDGQENQVAVLSREDLNALTRAEYLKNETASKLEDEALKARLEPVENVIFAVKNSAHSKDTPSLSALPLARFLASQHRGQDT